MKAIGRIIRFIPGFRKMSSSSIVIAATYYGAAILTLFKYWYWGLALLAAPFFIFYLLDLNAMKGRRLPLAVSIVAGIAVLLGTASGLSAGGIRNRDDIPIAAAATSAATGLPSSIAAAVLSPPPSASPAAPARPSSQQASPAATPHPSATAAPDQSQYAYVAAKGGKVFHLPGCASAKRIKPENIIGFKTRDAAIAAGLTPCKRCKP